MKRQTEALGLCPKGSGVQVDPMDQAQGLGRRVRLQGFVNVDSATVADSGDRAIRVTCRFQVCGRLRRTRDNLLRCPRWSKQQLAVSGYIRLGCSLVMPEIWPGEDVAYLHGCLFAGRVLYLDAHQRTDCVDW